MALSSHARQNACEPQNTTPNMQYSQIGHFVPSGIQSKCESAHPSKSARSFVMPEQCSQRIPLVRLYVNITHTTPQTTLHTLWMPPEDIHHHGPTQARKNRPPVLCHCPPHVPIAKQLPASSVALCSTVYTTATDLSRLYREFGYSETHTRSNIYDDLLGHGVVDCTAEDGVASD